MPSAPALPVEILDALARGCLILTANQRAARTLQHAYDRHRQALCERMEGPSWWEPPQILAWDSWLASLWHDLLLTGGTDALLLSRLQEHLVWRTVLAADAEMPANLRPMDSLAELAAEAWSRLHAYQGRPLLRSAAHTTDTRAFARWADAFDRQCRRHNYTTQAQLSEMLRIAFAEERLPAPKRILLVGFDHRTPVQDALLTSLQSSGAAIDELNGGANHRTGASTLVVAADLDAELATAARWLDTYRAEHPDHRIAVIAPALESSRAAIDRAFRPILAPEAQTLAAAMHREPYEFSLGAPLSRSPIVGTALDLLRWAASPRPLDRITALLLSPHVAACDPREATEEHLTRAEFDAFVLRQQPLLRPELSLEGFLTLASPQRHRAPQTLLRALRAFAAAVAQSALDRDRTHAEWAATIQTLLEAAAWPSRTLDSIEFQTLERWDHALDSLSTLDFMPNHVSWPIAIAALERIASQTLFAPESRNAPIQIMGPLEAAGSSFDAIWFLHAADLAWPTPPSASPLLPWRLQRDLGMPGANPGLDAAFAQAIAARVVAQATTVLFSYARSTTESRQRPSPALLGLALTEQSAEALAPAPPAQEPVALERIEDTASIPPPPDHVLPGGASILKAQADCAFRAFAEKRLHSTGLDAPTLGLDAIERGSLVHRVLESFWLQLGETRTQAALEALTTADRDARLVAAIDRTLHGAIPAPSPGWAAAYLQTERERLLRLLRPWLDYELTRGPFAVEALEKRLAGVQIGPLRLDVRVDRIDQALDADGHPLGEIILDYKTGQARPKEWLGDRPEQPQLPLYAVVSDAPTLAAVAFACVRPGKEMGLRGYQAEGVDALPKPTRLPAASLDAQREQWYGTLIQLATSFYAGDASVSPRRYPQTCAHCGQRLLCRLDPEALTADALDPVDDSEFADA